MDMKYRQNLYLKLVLCGILFAIAYQTLHAIGIFLTMKYYVTPVLSQSINPLMLPQQGPPSVEFLLLSFVFGVIQGVLLSYIYTVIRKGIPGKTRTVKGLVYGNILFIIATVSGSFNMILMVQLPLVLVGAWALENLIAYLIYGIVAGTLLD